MSPTRSASVCKSLFQFGPGRLISAVTLAFTLLLTLAPLQAAASLGLSGNLRQATVGQPYSAAISVKGGIAPFQFSIASGQLPAGLSLNAANGSISGVPLSQGTYNFTVRVSDRPHDGTGSKAFTLTVEPGSIAGSISVSITPQNAAITSGASQSFVASVSGTSNTGVTWATTAGSVSGTGVLTAPTVSAATSVTVTATSVVDPSKKASASVSVSPQTSAAPSISTSAVPPATVGVAYASGISATGGQLPYQWSIASGSLPQGIQFDSTTGALNGTANQQGQFGFSAKVTDAASHTATQNFTLTVSSQPVSGQFDGPAELPRVYIQTLMATTPSPGSTIMVPSGGNLQTAINAASCGDTLLLQAGATFTGLFSIPAKSCDNAHWITIRTSSPNSALPPEGTRLTPCHAGVASLPGRPSFKCSSTSNVMAKIVYNGLSGDGPISFAPGANYYRLVGLEITRAPGAKLSSLVSVKNGPADHIVIDRSWLHGTAQDETQSGVRLNGVTNGSIVDSFFTDFHCISVAGACTDAKAIGGGNGGNPGGPYKIVNNFLEASGQGILFGGGGATVTPTDIEIRRNHFFKPLQWKAGAAGFVGSVSGNPFIVKNHFELKNAQRVLFEGNILENVWGGFSQSGYSIVLTPKNQHQGTTNICPICQVTDVTIRYNQISHSGAGFQIATSISGSGTGGGMALAGARYSIHDITLDDISGSQYTGSGTLLLVANSWTANVLNMVSVNHITGLTDPSGHAMTLGNSTTNPSMSGFSFTNNIVIAGRYPVWNTGGGSLSCAYYNVPLRSLSTCFRSYVFSFNALIGVPSAFPATTWPLGNSFPATPTSVGFVNYNNGNGGDYHLLSSSPYKNKGSDGKDLGADVSAIQAATAGVY
jgi:Putative Ig domain